MTRAPQFAFPFGFEAGRTAGCDEERHIRDIIEQLLLTRPGERVNRPDLGAGLMHAVFGAVGPEAATALELASRAALHRYLGDIIEVESLTGRAENTALVVDVQYSIRRTAERRTANVTIGKPV